MVERLAFVLDGSARLRFAPRGANGQGKLARQFSKAQDWSRSEFAVKLQLVGFDISRGGVSKIENRTAVVNEKKVLCLAETLKVPLQDLFLAMQEGC